MKGTRGISLQARFWHRPIRTVLNEEVSLKAETTGSSTRWPQALSPGQASQAKRSLATKYRHSTARARRLQGPRSRHRDEDPLQRPLGESRFVFKTKPFSPNWRWFLWGHAKKRATISVFGTSWKSALTGIRIAYVPRFFLPYSIS